jgi:phosphate starvation-inducible PhoH-like protein
LDAVETVAGMEGVACIHFTDRDVVRHPLVSRIVKAYGARSAGADADAVGK